MDRRASDGFHSLHSSHLTTHWSIGSHGLSSDDWIESTKWSWYTATRRVGKCYGMRAWENGTARVGKSGTA